MKKLLALVLCVMMFVSVLSTAAFAEQNQPLPTYGSDTKWGSLNAANKAISNTKKNIDYIYGALAADTAVFGTVKAMDSVVVDMVKSLFADVDTISKDGTDAAGRVGTWYITSDSLEKNAKAVLRDALGGEIADYMNSHLGSYTTVGTHYELNGSKLVNTGVINDNGFVLYAVGNDIYAMDATGKVFIPDTTGMPATVTTAADRAAWLQHAGAGRFVNQVNPAFVATVQDFHYDPMKYAQAFATATSKALSSEKGIANIQAFAYGLMQLKAADAVSDKMDDLMDEIAKWEDGTRILKQYGFADFDIFGNDPSLDPYAFIDPEVLPKASMDLSDIVKTDNTSYFIPDFPVNP
jgi:hypothetical protein